MEKEHQEYRLEHGRLKSELKETESMLDEAINQRNILMSELRKKEEKLDIMEK